MRPLFKTSHIAAVITMAAMTLVSAEQGDATKEIQKTLQEYLTAMSARDTNALQSLMGQHLAIIEAGREKAKIGFLDTSNGKELLPPEQNHDWDKDKMRLSSLKVEVSPTHPSVAVASLTLSFPLTDERIDQFKTALQQRPDQWNDEEKKALQKMIDDKAVHNSMFAMLARQGGQWKIVCLSVPK